MDTYWLDGHETVVFDKNMNIDEEFISEIEPEFLRMI